MQERSWAGEFSQRKRDISHCRQNTANLGAPSVDVVVLKARCDAKTIITGELALEARKPGAFRMTGPLHKLMSAPDIAIEVEKQS